jgi:hypothetical protein
LCAPAGVQQTYGVIHCKSLTEQWAQALASGRLIG